MSAQPLDQEKARQDIENRKKMADISKLSTEQVSAISEEIGKRIAGDIQTVYDRARAMLSLYGLDINILYSISEKPTEKRAASTKTVKKPVTKAKKKTKKAKR